MPPFEMMQNPYAVLPAVSVSYHEIMLKWLVTIRESRKDIIYTTHFISLGTHFHIGSRGLVISGTLLLVPCFRHDVRFRLGTDEQPNRSNGMNESN